MPQPYNLSNITGARNIYEVTKGANDVAGGSLGLMLLVGIFVIFFFSFKTYSTKRAFAGASFITAVISIFIRLLDFIPDRYMFGAFLLAGIGFLALKFEGN